MQGPVLYLALVSTLVCQFVCNFKIIFVENIIQFCQELTQYLSTIWEEWVELTPSAKQSIAEGGYYSLPVRNGLRIISFNSDYG